MKLLDAILPRNESRGSLTDYLNWYTTFSVGGNTYNLPYQTTMPGQKAEPISDTLTGYVRGGFQSNAVVFGLERVRIKLFSQGRFQFQQLRKGRPGDLFSLPELDILEHPWPGGTTGDLLAALLLDADMAGNAYVTKVGRQLVRLRPDWVEVVLGDRIGGVGPPSKAGYFYYHGGKGPGGDPPVMFLVNEVAHFMPMPDPLWSYRGMSWLTPVIRELQADTAATTHKLKFFENAASPNLAVSLPKEVTPEQFEEFVNQMDSKHSGVDNAYKTLYTGGGADVTVIGTDMRQMDFKTTQGAGEPIAVDTPVPTPSGWTTMGELVPGDRVFGVNGLPATVVAVSPVHVGRECYRVTFNDRTSIVADGGHLWSAIDRNTLRRVPLEYTTNELRALIAEWSARGNGGNRIGIAPPSAVKAPEADLLLDPYVLGVWLGDGSTSGASICGADDDLAVIASEIESRGYTVTHWKPQPDKVSVIGLPGGVLAALRALGVLGSKHIPIEYLRSSYDQRLDLLRGLMDTDGSVGVRGKETCEFSSKYEHLARQVAELVRSLGQRATVSVKNEPRSRTGVTWRVTFRADPTAVPFMLPRKVERCVTPLHVRNRAIVSIEPVESVPVRCITVDTEDRLFLAGAGWVPTHNTRLALAAGIHPSVAGLSEGMQGSSLNAGNFGQARRQTADIELAHLWGNVASSLEVVVHPPRGARLTIDRRDIPFLAEDQKDAAEILSRRMLTVESGVRAGYKPESIVAAVTNDDLSLLEHTGLFSVQLQPPMTDHPAVAAGADPATDPAAPPAA